MAKRTEKKSETLEVRLPHSKKKAFMEACEREGITASHAVRTFVDAYVRRSRRVKLKTICQELSMKLIQNPLKVTSAGAVALVTATLLAAQPSMAQPDAFTALDRNEDGVLTSADSKGISMIVALIDKSGDTNSDGVVTRAEFKTLDVLTADLSSGEVQKIGDLDTTKGKLEITRLMVIDDEAATQDLSAEGIATFLEEKGIHFGSDEGQAHIVIKRDDL